MNMMQRVIETRNLSKRFGAVTALDERAPQAVDGRRPG